MPCAARPNLGRLCFAFIAATALPITLLAQDKPGVVLPPPSLYDSGPPAEQAAPVTTMPRVESAPAPARTAEPKPAAPLAQPPAAAAPRAAKPAAPAAMTAPVAPSGDRAALSMQAPKKLIRTGGPGACVRMGRASPDALSTCPGTGLAKAAAPASASAAAPIPQPVVVQPLPTPQLKQERALEPEVVAVTESPPPAALVAEPVPAPVTQMHTLSADALFALGSFTLKPSARVALDDLVARLKEVTYQSIKITGHTDPTGPAASNARLSKQRAEEVKRYLVEHGVNADRVAAEGVGSTMPMVIERDCARLPRAQKVACYQPDRRVDIEVIGALDKLAGQ